MLSMVAMRTLISERIRPALRSVSRLPVDTAGRALPRQAILWREILKQAVVLWLVTRVAYALITFFAVTFTAGIRNPASSYSPGRLLDLWQRLDVSWYLAVAVGGYTQDVTRTAFFPLYPLLVALVTLVIGASHRLFAAMLVSNLSALAAFFGIGLLAMHEENMDTARAAMLMLAAYPLAFFTVAGYADATLLALCVLALFCARWEHWRWAALCSLLAGLTRPTAVILILPLFWEYGRQYGVWRVLGTRRWDELRERMRLGALAEWGMVTAAVPAGIGLYALYLWRTFGNPLTFVTLQATRWHRQLVPPWAWIRLVAHSWRYMPAWSFGQARTLVDLGPLLICLALTLVLIRQRWSLTYVLYMLGVLYTAVSDPKVTNQFPLAAAGRYLLPAIPIFLLLGRWTRTRPALRAGIVAGGFALQTIFSAYFLNGGWLI